MLNGYVMILIWRSSKRDDIDFAVNLDVFLPSARSAEVSLSPCDIVELFTIEGELFPKGVCCKWQCDSSEVMGLRYTTL